MVFRKVDLGGSKLTCQTLLLVDLSLPDIFAERRRTAVDDLSFRLCTSPSVPELFAILV